MEKQCYFCEACEKATEKLYVFKKIDGKHVPVQVSVCKECKAEYEASFPKY